ncbi:GntR family transcriptional regulator [Halomonas eurihalina]|uniref:GntR family transcriptional regulator n=2 Tax=Halomonas eurihalina TaxID=42566 RepID=A0A5D9DCR5_HALER|nr:GntR family transcriptional regulator [Halomonas eurihalina]MDR5859520.1 GntR family transcriptional regulator [Halomonas eurihalina]TZG40445.1 GntR family transcriptional regulator [Halomonas eurihalina]
MDTTLQNLWKETTATDPVSQRLYQVLREAIIRMILLPGTMLSEKEIAETFAVSRQPVREALVRLSELGLIEVRPQRGTFVLKISKKMVLEARFVREAIEMAVVKLAASKGLAPKTLDNLHELLECQQRCLTTGDSDRFYRLDEDFHHTLALGVHQQSAWKVVKGVRAQFDRVRYLSIPDSSPTHKLYEQHVEILTAIERKDEQGASQAMQSHLREVLISLPELMERKPNMFEDEPI